MIIYDFVNEDDDFFDLDKDDFAAMTQKKTDDDEALPMPILATGFDFDDYVPDFKKKGRPGEKKEVRYTSKRYGGGGAAGKEGQVDRTNPDKGVPEGFSRYGKKYNRFAKEGERKLQMASMTGFGDAIAGGGEDPIEKACWMFDNTYIGYLNRDKQETDVVHHMRACLKLTDFSYEQSESIITK